jgi:hypothetical protein
MEQKKKEPFNFEKMPLKQIPSERLMTPVVIYEDGTTNLKEVETEKTYELEEVFKIPRQVEMESDYITTIWSDGTTGLKKDKTEKADKMERRGKEAKSRKFAVSSRFLLRPWSGNSPERSNK